MKKPDGVLEIDKLLHSAPQCYLDPFRVREDASALCNCTLYSSVLPKRTERGAWIQFFYSHNAVKLNFVLPLIYFECNIMCKYAKNQQTYDIPISIVLLENYPHVAPEVTVLMTQGTPVNSSWLMNRGDHCAEPSLCERSRHCEAPLLGYMES